MKHLTHWILALAAITCVAGFTGAWTTQQEPPKKERKLNQAPSTKRQSQNRALKLDTLKRALPDLKMPLSEAVQLAEKETTGKAFSADLEVMAGKPIFQVNLFVKDQLTSTNVDPVTKKVTTITGKKGDDEEGSGGDGEGG